MFQNKLLFSIGSSFQALGLVLQKKSHDKERDKQAKAIADDPNSTATQRNCCLRKGNIYFKI